jgi:alpha-amylase
MPMSFARFGVCSPLPRSMVLALAAGTVLGFSPMARAQISPESPPPMLQWFECKWTDMERRMPDYFNAGWGRVWLPPVSKGYLDPRNSNQNGDSAGYDPFNRFDLGSPGSETAYGTEAYFDALVDEFHRASGEVFVDMVLNHNAGRQTSVQFQNDGGYPGFWMNPGPNDKQPTDNWGDFNAGVAGGYYQSENPGGARYCLLAGDLVSLIDIDQASNHQFIRQPTTAGNPANLPAGEYFNKPNPANTRYYFDPSLGTTSVNNPGMFTGAGNLTSSPFGQAPCNVPARSEGASVYTTGKFNTSNPSAGVPTTENATGYMLRWVQWMMDVHKVDGFRIDAVKHTPSWFFDSYYDAVVANRRQAPNGQFVTPYSFGESVEGNDFTFDRYIRKVNGRTTGRSVAGDAFGNRDALDLNGAGQLRDLINGNSSWSTVQTAHLDNTDDGFNNGSIGVAHIFSHDNGSNGNGSAQPGVPNFQSQGWFAHAYLLMRNGQAKVYHNARGVTRSGGFWPREGVPVALGWEPLTSTQNSVITNLVQLSNWYGRGWYFPRVTDSFVQIFERATDTGGGVFSGNVLVGCNRSYAGSGITSYDERTFNTAFPAGTRLIEMTGNAANANVDPSSQIPEVVTVGANGSVTIRVPRNQNFNGLTHNRGFVVYGPAIPSGTLSIVRSSGGTLAADSSSIPDVRQRLASIPVVSSNTFSIELTTTNGDPGAGNNNNADDAAVFRIDGGFQDWNGNGVVDVDSNASAVVPGFEQFVTLRQPLANTSNTNGLYKQTIDTTRLSEGMHYITVTAFRKRNAVEAPLFREFRTPVYVDRTGPDVNLGNTGPFSSGNITFNMITADRTLLDTFLMVDLPSGTDPLTQLNTFTRGSRIDRFQWNRTVTGLTHGFHDVTIVGREESLRTTVKNYTIFVDLCPSDINDDGEIDFGDFLAFFNCYDTEDACADIDENPGVDFGDFLSFFNGYDSGC